MRKPIVYQVANPENKMTKVPVDIIQYDDGGPGMEFSYADGYGFWCGKKCAEGKKKAGIPPLGFGKKNKADQTKNEAAAIAALSKPDTDTKALLDSLNKQSVSSPASSKPAPKSNTMMYAAIGGGILLLGGIAFFVLRGKK